MAEEPKLPKSDSQPQSLAAAHCSADGGPLWECVKMTDHRRGLWYRVLPSGEVQVRAGREGDDDIARITGSEAKHLAWCLARVACVSRRPQPFARFSDLLAGRERRKKKPNDLAVAPTGREKP